MRTIICHIWFIPLLITLAFSDALGQELEAEGARSSVFIDFHPGDLPLIISVPHGGYEQPEGVPDRTMGTKGHHDVQTLEMGNDISKFCFERTGRRPYLIINRLHRSKLDANREQFDAAQDDPSMMAAWEAYHQYIDSAKTAVARRFGAGLYIDLHGHRHAIQRTEIGYLLVASDLVLADDSLNALEFVSKSSLRSLAYRSPLPFAGLIRGDSSFGGILERDGYPAVPSPNNPDPGGKPFFSGGYNLERHGSRDGGMIDGLQVEAPLSVRESEAERIAYAKALTRTMLWFLDYHYNANDGHAE